MNRVSQGSGAMLLAAAELAEMARIGADSGIEVSLFVGPREEWDIGRAGRSSGDGASRAGLSGGSGSSGTPSTTCCAAVDQGSAASSSPTPACCSWWPTCRRPGSCPASVVWKVSAVLAPSNPLAVHASWSGSAARPSTCRRT